MVDWTDIFETEYNATRDRYIKQQDRLQKQEGFGSTDGGMALVQGHLDQLLTTFDHHLDLARNANGIVAGLVPNLLQMDRRLLALCALQTLLHTLGDGVAFGQQVANLGLALEAECFRAGLTKHDRKLEAEVARRARDVRGRTAVRRGKARAEAARLGYKVPEWAHDCLMAAGGWMMDWTLSTLPDLFVIEGANEWKSIRLTEGALAIAQAAVDRCSEQRPVFLPRPTCPDPWTRLVATDDTGPFLPQRHMLIRTRSQDRLATVKEAILDGSAQPTLDGLNALQSVSRKINRRVLLVQMACKYLGIEVGGLPGKRLDMQEQAKKVGCDMTTPWADLSQEQRRLWATTARAVRNHNSALVGEELTLAEDWAAAKMYRSQPFWTPMNLDWRGRTYARCRFNFQRDDRVRALFLREHGEPLGDQGLDALMIHAANCYAGNSVEGDKSSPKTDKIPFKERIAWAVKNLDLICACARSPLTERFWMTADAPWSFLAVSFEILGAKETSGPYVCHLPVAFDGSCSGIQHLSLLTKAQQEATLVNLTSTAAPADIYSAVALVAEEQIAIDAKRTDWPEDHNGESTAWRGDLARLALAYGIDRKMAKRNTMTWAYSSKRYGMGGQQQEDLMDKLSHDILTGKHPEPHPFAPYHRGSVDHPGKAARYLGGIFYDAIEQVMSLPGQAMLMLQGLAKTLAHEGKYVKWVSPAGLPCINHYNPITVDRLALYTHIRGVKVRHQTLVATGEEATVDKAKAASGISPNFVHSHDAAHVHLVAGACAKEGIELDTVHDSFACLPNHAARMNAILREQLVAMYDDTNLLQEVWDRAACALTASGQQRLPPVPIPGTLDVREVLNAEYAFA